MLDACESDSMANKEAEVILTESSKTLKAILPFISAKRMGRIGSIQFPDSFDFIYALLKYEVCRHYNTIASNLYTE